MSIFWIPKNRKTGEFLVGDSGVIGSHDRDSSLEEFQKDLEEDPELIQVYFMNMESYGGEPGTYYPKFASKGDRATKDSFEAAYLFMELEHGSGRVDAGREEKVELAAEKLLLEYDMKKVDVKRVLKLKEIR
jgi:hypothetical protein